jgi:hypothetical protein|tara:strand:- start:104 stop:421 length:318 start_codon:yes stop_codon:yes gene_type:complete
MASKKLKKLAKAALIGGALYAGAKGLGKRKLSKAVSGMDDAGLGVHHNAMKNFGPYTHKMMKRSGPGNIDPGPTLAAKGGRIGAKSGGRVKSMGIAKRGGGAVKR